MKAESEAVRMFSLDRCHAVRQVSVYCGYSQNTILSLERDGSTGPTFQLRLFRIMVQLFGGNLEQEKRKRSGGSLNLSCPNFPFVCVSKWGSVPKLPTTNSTQMDRTVLLIRYSQFYNSIKLVIWQISTEVNMSLPGLLSHAHVSLITSPIVQPWFKNW